MTPKTMEIPLNILETALQTMKNPMKTACKMPKKNREKKTRETAKTGLWIQTTNEFRTVKTDCKTLSY